MTKDIPSKLYYSISEVSRITEVKAHVLRYWESEFPTLRVKKSRTGSRRYRRADIDEVLAIKELLYNQGFKIAGARKMRKQDRLEVQAATPAEPKQLNIGFVEMDQSEKFKFLATELKDLLQMVREMAPAIALQAKETGKTTESKKPLKKMEGTA